MALTIKSFPSDSSSVTNAMLFVIDESVKAHDETTYPNYKYVLDIYVSSVLVARMKATPDPAHGFGIFDVSKILQNYTPAYGLNVASEKLDYDIRASYQCKLGEEYGDTLYTNLVTDSTRYFLSAYMVDAFTSNTGNYASGMASTRPNPYSIFEDDAKHLVPYFNNVSGIADLTVTQYDKNGVSLGAYVFTNATYPANKVRQYDLFFGSGNPINPNASYAVLTGAISNHRINFMCSKRPVITLAWLNSLGAYESQGFGFVSKKSIEISKKQFSQIPYQINVSGEVSYESNNVLYGSNRQFTAITKTTMKLTSHLLTAEEYAWLAEMFRSVDIYFYDSSNDWWVPVKIRDGTYEFRTYDNSRLKPLEFEIEFTTQYNSQNL